MTYRIPILCRILTPVAVSSIGFGACAQTQTALPVPNLTLAAATSAALAQNPTALAARQQFLQAQARADQATAQLRSQVSFSSSVGVSNADVLQPPPSHETFGTFTNTFALPLPLGKKPRLAVIQANLQLQAAQAAFDSARLALSTSVSTQYYDLLRKEALLIVAQGTLANANRQLEETRKRFRAGDVPELDVLRAQIPVAAAEVSVYQAENDVTIAKQMLNSVIGRPLDTPVELAPLAGAATNGAPQASEPEMSIDEARTIAVKNSPDVRSAEAAELAADAGVKIARLSHEPVYAFQVSDSRSNDQTSFSRLDSLQATITIPLSDGGLAKAQQRESTAAREQAHAQTEVARRSAALAVSTSYLGVRTTIRQVAAAQTAVEIAQTTYDKTQTGYQAGLFPLTDVLNAQTALAQARVALTQATYDAAVARTSLNNALGILP